MAELEVQPKKKSPFLWILVLLAIVALFFFLLRGCGKDATRGADGADSSKVIAATVADWDSVDFNAPTASYDEVTDKGIEIRGNKGYSIYGLGENILFATDESNIQNGAAQQLNQIAASLKKRFDGASIAVYGNTDATGSAGHNIELGAARAKAVKTWLVQKAGIAEDRISVRSHGESAAEANNATPEGRQLNRNVQIVALANK